MAQTANITPVVLEKDNSIQVAGQMISNAMKERSAQQAAVKEAILKQRNANDAIFGADTKDMREYAEKVKTLAPAEVDRIFTEGVAEISKLPKDSPDFRRQSSAVVNKAFSALKGLGQTFADTDAVIDEMTKAGMKINPDAVRRLALTNMYNYRVSGQDNTRFIEGLRSGVIEPVGGMTREQAIQEAMMNGQVQVKELKPISDLQNFGANLRDEINAHPELYADRGGVKQDAVSSISKMMSQASKVETGLELDPTGTRTIKLGVSYLKSMFDTDVNEKDKITGLGYLRPKLNTTPVSGLFYKGGESVDALAEEPYQLLLNSGGPSVQNELTISALENIREHNAEAFRRARIASPDKISLTVSKSNVDNFRDIPGFIDPFDEGQIEVFQRAAAADLLKQSGKYDDKGFVTGVSLNRGDNKANPKSGVTVNVGQTGPGVDKGVMAGFNTLYKALKAGQDPMSSTKIDNNIKNALLTIADQNSVFRSANIKVAPGMINVKIAADGSVGIYSKATGDLLASLSEQSFNQRVNDVASGKFVDRATVQGNPDPTTSGKQYMGIDPKTGKAIFQ